MLCIVLIDSCFLWPLSTGGGGGGARGAMKSPFATDLLGAVGLLELRGGGASKLGRNCGESKALALALLLPRESVLDASANDEGTEDAEPLRSWLGASFVDAILGDGAGIAAGGSGVVGFALSTDAARESPRAGLSACFGGGTEVGADASFRFGSSKGLTPDPGESTDTGECVRLF